MITIESMLDAECALNDRLEQRIVQLQRELAQATQRTMYKACPKHQDLVWNFTATVAMPAVEVCPHCEQEAMKK